MEKREIQKLCKIVILIKWISKYILRHSEVVEQKSKNRNLPKIKLSGLKSCPKGPDRTESIVPGSRSSKIARGTYLPPKE